MERSVAVGSELLIDARNELLDEESREEFLVPAQIHTAIDLIDTDHDLWRRGVVVSITDDVVARGGDGDVEELFARGRRGDTSSRTVAVRRRSSPRQAYV